MADKRDREDSSPNAQKTTSSEGRERVIRVPAPTQDQQSYLEEIKRSTGQYDPSVVIGGPRRAPK